MENKHLLSRALCAVVFLSLACVLSQAQGVGSSRGLASSSGGIHVIQGRIYDTTGKQSELRLRVRLESPHSTTQYASTDADGAFIFNQLQNGDYTLTVEGGSTYENAVERPSISRDGSPGGRIIQLAIGMRPRMSLDPAFASVPKSALDLYVKALDASKKGDNKKAAEQLSKAIAIDPKFGPALSELGGVYLKLGEPAKAAESLEAAVKIAPDDFQTRLNYGIALLQQKKFPEAEAQLLVATAKNPSAATPHMYLGLALMSQKKLDEAEKELRLSVASSSSEVAPAHKYLGGIYWGQRDYKRAIEELETYLKLLPKAPDADRMREGIKELKAKL